MEYGLTEYQARVYLALLDLGVAKVSQIPALSRVPRTRIYTAMRELHAKGLVQVLPEKPLRYRAVPFAAYLRNLAEDYRDRARRLEANVDMIGRQFVVPPDDAPEARGRFEAIYGRRNVRNKLVEMYEGAEREIIAVGSTHSPRRILRSLGTQVADRTQAGVSVKCAFHPTPGNEADIRAIGRHAEVRLIDFFVPVCRHGVDGRQFLMSHPIPDDESLVRGEDIAIWTDDVAIAAAMGQMTEHLWEMGRPATPDPEEASRSPLTTAQS